MAYSKDNVFQIPAALTGQSSGRSLWFYTSTDDFATVKASGYISNAYEMGMRAGDPIFVIDTDASPPTVTLAAIATCTDAPACTMAQTGVVPST